MSRTVSIVLDFLHCERPRTRENSVLGQTGVVRVRTAAVGVYVAVTGNLNVITVWTALGTTINCLVLLFALQRKFPRRETVRILQSKEKTLQTRISHAPAA
jgi:hypothetical protein